MSALFSHSANRVYLSRQGCLERLRTRFLVWHSVPGYFPILVTLQALFCGSFVGADP